MSRRQSQRAVRSAARPPQPKRNAPAANPNARSGLRKAALPVVVLLLLAVVGTALWYWISTMSFAGNNAISAGSNAPIVLAKPGPQPPEIRGSALVASNPSSTSASPPKDQATVDLNQQANELLNARDFKGAIQLYEKAIAAAPEDEDLHYNLGIAYAKAGDTEKAEKEYREALRLLPDYAEVHNNLGNLLLRSGRLKEADDQFAEAIALMPEYAAAHNNLGIVRQRQKRLLEAKECFQKAARYDTNYLEAHYNLATSYLLENSPDKALPEFRETLRINPGFEPAQRAVAKLTENKTQSSSP